MRWVFVLVLAIVVAGCDDDRPARDESGQVAEPQQVSIFHLQTGDCFRNDLPRPEAVEVVPCSEPHNSEIYHSFALPAGEVSGDAEMRQAAAERCFPAFAAYVGIPFEASELIVFPLLPAAEPSEGSSRIVNCVLYQLGVGELVGSARGTGPQRDQSGQLAAAQDLSIFHLQTGDCFNDPEADQLPDLVQVEGIPCSQPHDSEIYYSFTLPDGVRPAEDQLAGLAADQCIPAFEAFVGIAFEFSELDVFPLTPTAEQWEEQDHRTVHCVLFNLDLSELVGSARGTAR